VGTGAVDSDRSPQATKWHFHQLFQQCYFSNHLHYQLEGVAVNDIEQFTMAPANDFSFSATDRNLLTQTITNTGTSSVSSALYAFDFGGRVSVKVSTLLPACRWKP